MSQTESPVVANVDLVPAKAKRKPRTSATSRSTLLVDELPEQYAAPVEAAPKVRRARRGKADATSIPTSVCTSINADLQESSLATSTPAIADNPVATLHNDVCVVIGNSGPVHPLASARLHADVVTLAHTVRGGRTALLPALGDDSQIGLRLAADPATPVDPYCALVLHFPGWQIELGDGVRLMAALTGIDLGHSAVELPNTQWLHSAVIGRLGQTPLRDAISITRGGLPAIFSERVESNVVDVAGCEAVVETPTSIQTMHLTLRSQQHAFSIQARAHAAAWIDFLTRAHWQREQLPLDTFNDMPVNLPVLIATHALPFAMLADITVGDVVLPETATFDCTGNGHLRWRGMQLRVEFPAPATLTIHTLESRMELPHDAADTADDAMIIHAAPASSSTHPSDSLDGLPVQLQFEMGRCHTTLKNLRTLAAGTVLPIEGGSPSAIAIIANGRQLGKGELVEVNGQLGIRIVHWAV